ncbi:MAG TPA: PadR family transcriptional regulator [Gammaproteobacteria bacterium]|nr:PadR family transcriptional regulator [Gammaproteobacteria bacterium]
MKVKDLCLGALSFGDASGYDLKQFFEQTFNHFCVAGFGSIYPALAELANEGLVTYSEEQQQGRQDRRVYHLTPAGHEAFVREIETTEPQHRVKSDFLLILYFAHLLSPERLEAVLDNRIAQLDRQLELIRQCRDSQDRSCAVSVGADFVHGFGAAAMSAARDYLRNNRGRLVSEVQAARNQRAHPHSTQRERTASRPAHPIRSED